MGVCPSVKVETLEELAVRAKPEQLVQVLKTLPSDAVVLCVGHEPFLGEFVSLLLCGKTLPTFPVKKAGAVCVEVEGQIRAGQCRLRWWFPPMPLRVLGTRVRTKRLRQQS
jgi:phosphohistidine phosphatase